MSFYKLNEEEISKYSLISFSALIPTFPFSSSIGLILFFLSAAILLCLKKKIKIYPILLFGIIYFVIYLYSIFYSYNIPEAISYLIKISPILLLPCLIGVFKIDRITSLYVKKSYLYSVFFVSILSIIYRSTQIIFFGSSLDSLFYISLSDVFHLHPTYLSMYVLLALWFTFNIRFTSILLKYILIGTYCIIILLLESRMGVIFMLMTILYLVYKKISFKKFIFLSISLISLVVYTQRDRFIDFKFNENKLIGSEYSNGISQRWWIWSEAYLMIKESPFFGYGSKSREPYFGWFVEKQIMETDVFKGYENSARVYSTYNFHNQYLQIIFDTGFIGFVLFLISMILMFKYALEKKKLDFIFFIILILSFLLSENILDRQMGIYFYAFFLSFLLRETHQYDISKDEKIK